MSQTNASATTQRETFSKRTSSSDPSGIDVHGKILSMNDLIMAIIVLVVMVALIIWIVSSRFIDRYSVTSAFFIFGLAFACFRGAQMLKGESDWRFMGILAIVVVLGGYLINLHNVNHAWSGALILIFAFVADAGYSAYMKWGGASTRKPAKERDPILLFGGLACDAVLIGLLIYGISGDM